MDLFQLTYFIEVAHKKSFTKASKSLHISQPSISKGIKALEGEKCRAYGNGFLFAS